MRWLAVVLLALAPLLWWGMRTDPEVTSTPDPIGDAAPTPTPTAVVEGETARLESPSPKASTLPAGSSSQDACAPFAELALLQPTSQPDESADAYRQRADQHIDQLMGGLNHSQDPDHLFALSFSPHRTTQEQLELARQAAALDPDNPLFRYRALGICASGPPVCAQVAELERDLLRVAPDNSEALIMVAASCLMRADAKCAYRYLDRAGAASEVSAYFGETITHLDRALTATDLSYQQRVELAFSLGATAPVPFGLLAEFCRGVDPVPSVPSASVIEACIAYGERSASGADTVLAQKMGEELARLGYIAQGYTPEEARTHLRERLGGSVELAVLSIAMYERLLSDEAFFRRYLAQLIDIGESAAQAWVSAQMVDWQPSCAAELIAAREGEGPAPMEQDQP